MEIENTGLDGLVVIHRKVFTDERGYFSETFHEEKFKQIARKVSFQQDNLSFSKKGTIRGMHFQCPPYAQAKLVFVPKGKVIDVVVDLRQKSPTFGQAYSREISDANNLMMFVPAGFAHGFEALEDSIFIYKCSSVYNKESEGGFLYSDAITGLPWLEKNPIVSEKDLSLPSFKEALRCFS